MSLEALEALQAKLRAELAATVQRDLDDLDYSRAMLAVYRAGEVVRQLAEARTLLADALPHLPEELQERVRLSVLAPRTTREVPLGDPLSRAG